MQSPIRAQSKGSGERSESVPLSVVRSSRPVSQTHASRRGCGVCAMRAQFSRAFSICISISVRSQHVIICVLNLTMHIVDRERGTTAQQKKKVYNYRVCYYFAAPLGIFECVSFFRRSERPQLGSFVAIFMASHVPNAVRSECVSTSSRSQAVYCQIVKRRNLLDAAA